LKRKNSQEFEHRQQKLRQSVPLAPKTKESPPFTRQSSLPTVQPPTSLSTSVSPRQITKQKQSLRQQEDQLARELAQRR
jgi:hypothetical protein